MATNCNIPEMSESREQQYERILRQIMVEHQCNLSKAKRIFKAITRKRVEKFMKDAKKRRKEIEKSGKLVDTSDIVVAEEAPLES